MQGLGNAKSFRRENIFMNKARLNSANHHMRGYAHIQCETELE